MENSDYLLVSVIIPLYNGEAFISQTLQSVLNQTYKNLEILVVDDGSRDRAPEIVQQFAQKDPRIRLLQQANAGVAAARNWGIQEAQGEFIAPIDADDLWQPDTLTKLITQFQQGDLNLGVVYAWSVDIDESNQLTGGFHAARVEGNVYKTLLCHNFLGNASSTLIRKTCLDQVGGYETELKAQSAQGCEDWDLYLRLAERYEFAVVPEFLIRYRKLNSGMSGNFQQMARSQQLMLKAAQDKHPEIPFYLYRISRSSFYLFLAQQSDLNNHPRETLAWLWQAIKIDWITPICRLGWYVLLVKSLLKHLQSRESYPNVNRIAIPQALSFLSKPQLSINPLKIWLKVFVGNILHYSLSKIQE